MPLSMNADEAMAPPVPLIVHDGPKIQKTHESFGAETDDQAMPDQVRQGGPSSGPAPPVKKGAGFCSDRTELMERLKRGESPTWVPNHSLQQEYFKANGETIPVRNASSKTSGPVQSPSLLPPAEIEHQGSVQADAYKDVRSLAREIGRPRSALHAGDFTGDAASDHGKLAALPPSLPRPSHQSDGPLGSSPTTPWYNPATNFQDRHTQDNSFRERDYAFGRERRPVRDRAPSLHSFSSSSFILKAPTSPLVQQSNNADLDSASRDRSISPNKRRHTLPPHALRDTQASACSPMGNIQVTSHPQIGGTHPYGHRSRKSLTTTWSLQPSASPPSSIFTRSRRTSVSSDASPLQHASMVGSYEESILRGRMSTAPSKPLDFTAQIGVLGKNDCKPKCPPHVTVPFPAVYYNWTGGLGRSPISDEPSPYVGQIDLEHPVEQVSSRKSRQSITEPPPIDQGDPQTREDYNSSVARLDLHKSKKRRQTSPMPAPPAGSYRIPQQGQLQIIIKNPNKTAVKLFLVQYDLTDMEAGTKTFVRQRLYSTGPIPGTPNAVKSEHITSRQVGPARKPTLRYLIHLNICCPSAGRFYLYQHIRVVFANRVPDNKEQLTTETQIPTPKFSSWRPNRLSRQSSNASTKSVVDRAARRRSSGFGYDCESRDAWSPETFVGGSPFPVPGVRAIPPVPPIPFHLPPRVNLPTGSESANNDSDAMDVDVSRPTTGSDLQNSESEGASCIRLDDHSAGFLGPSSPASRDYEKLPRGDAGYRGLFGRPLTPEAGESLLAQSLRSLDMHHREKRSDDDNDVDV